MTENAPHARTEVKALELCASCGVLWKGRETKCKFCKADHGSKALTPPRFDDELWVWVETSFKCRACGFNVPLNHIDMDGAVICGKCGVEQAFEVKDWRDALELAHNVAADGAGTQDGFAKTTLDGGNEFTVIACPGHPLCETCHGPLAFAVEKRKADVSCGACKTVVSYVVPEAAWKMTRTALRAIISPEHRADHNAVKVDETGSAVAIHCPQCAAPLDASQGSKFIHCKYCNTTSRIPDDVWFRVSGSPPAPTPIWMAFSGVSPGRREAIKRQTDKARADAKDREIAEEKQRRALQHAHQQEMREAAEAKKKEEEEEAKRKAAAIQKAKEAKNNLVVVGVIIAILLLVAFGIVGFLTLSGTSSTSSTATTEPTPIAAPQPTRAPPTATHAVPLPPALRSATPARHH